MGQRLISAQPLTVMLKAPLAFQLRILNDGKAVFNTYPVGELAQGAGRAEEIPVFPGAVQRGRIEIDMTMGMGPVGMGNDEKSVLALGPAHSQLIGDFQRLPMIYFPRREGLTDLIAQHIRVPLLLPACNHLVPCLRQKKLRVGGPGGALISHDKLALFRLIQVLAVVKTVSHGTLSAETFLTVIVLSFGVMQPLITAFSYTDDIAQVKTIVDEMAEVLSDEDMQRPTTAEKLPADNAIQLKDVRFAYHDKEVLHGIDLHIAPGTVNALVGPSGSGKSTIARLIASLWDVKDGTIKLGGVDIRTLPLAECTKRIAYVSQDNYLFDLSVMDNIRMGKKGASDEEVIAAAKKCGCHEFIMGLENGYQTVCGASGGHLSGGERQRISIARAMLKDAPIVILDEATSYTDPENEAVIQSALARLVRGKTLLVIAHRLSTIADADQIIVVNQGKIEATGTQTELLASCPLYQNMWEAHISVKDDGEVA